MSDLTGGPRVRIVERGGYVLSHLLGRSDPWAAARSCRDPRCQTCATRSWLAEQKKVARKTGTKLPTKLVQSTVPNCRREGATYTLQCLECLQMDRSSLYHGESSRSPRQCHQEHYKDLQNGSISSPLVTHAIQEHGGKRPRFLYLIQSLEPKPLYRAVRESVMIARQPAGAGNLNRCQEWGTPRVPILCVSGGDEDRGPVQVTGSINPRPVWTAAVNEKMDAGEWKRGRDRVVLWEGDEPAR